jgi:hypothetical protein
MKSTCLIRNVGRRHQKQMEAQRRRRFGRNASRGSLFLCHQEEQVRSSGESSLSTLLQSNRALLFCYGSDPGKMRLHLAGLAKARLASAGGVAARTGGIISSMRPPNKLEENLLCQAICSGLLDNVAMIAPPGYLSGNHPFGFRSAYISCSLKEPLFMKGPEAVPFAPAIFEVYLNGSALIRY